MKKSILVFVLLMFMFSVIAIADNGDVSDTDVDTNIDIDVDDVTEEVITEEECGFWCETYKFLFGDAELRAATGTAWFDRQDALVGQGIYDETSVCSWATGIGNLCINKNRVYVVKKIGDKPYIVPKVFKDGKVVDGAPIGFHEIPNFSFGDELHVIGEGENVLTSTEYDIAKATGSPTGLNLVGFKDTNDFDFGATKGEWNCNLPGGDCLCTSGSCTTADGDVVKSGAKELKGELILGLKKSVPVEEPVEESAPVEGGPETNAEYFIELGDEFSEAGNYKDAADSYERAGDELITDGYFVFAKEEYAKAADLYMEIENYDAAGRTFKLAGNEESAKYAFEQADLAALNTGTGDVGGSDGSGSDDKEEKKPAPKKETKKEEEPKKEEAKGEATEYELGSLEDLEIFEEEKLTLEELKVNAVKDKLDTMAELTKESEELNKMSDELSDAYSEASQNFVKIQELMGEGENTGSMKTNLEAKQKESKQNIVLDGQKIDVLSGEIITLTDGLNADPLLSETATIAIKNQLDKKVAEKEVLERNVETEQAKLGLIDGQLKVLSGESLGVEELKAKLAKATESGNSLVEQQEALQSEIATLQKEITSPPEGIGNTFTLPDNKLDDQGFAYIKSSSTFVNTNGDVLTPKDDGTSTLEVKGGSGTLYTITYPAEGSNDGAKLEFGEGWDSLKGDYSDHKDIIDELHTLGFIPDDKYEEITGGSGWDFGIFNGEESMSEAKKIIGTPVVKTLTPGKEISAPVESAPPAPKKMASATSFKVLDGVIYQTFTTESEGQYNDYYISPDSNLVYDSNGFAVGRIKNKQIVFENVEDVPWIKTEKMIFLGNAGDTITVPSNNLLVPKKGESISNDNVALETMLDTLGYGNDFFETTEEGLKALQLVHLGSGEDDGVADPLTVEKMNELLDQKRVAAEKRNGQAAEEKEAAAKKAEEEAAEEKAEEEAAKKAAGTADDDAEKKVVAQPETLETIFASAQGIQQAVVCFETGRNCKSVDGEKVELTHSGASEKMAILAKAAREDADELFFKGPVLGPSRLTTSSVGATIKIGDKTYTKTEITNKAGEKSTQWLDENKKPATEEELEKAEDLALPGHKEAEKQAKELEEAAETLGWQGSWLEWKDGDSYRALAKGDWAGGQVVGGLGSLAGKLGSYQAISNALFPETTKDWMGVANDDFLNKWADLPAFALKEICEIDDHKRSELPGKASAFVRTQSGSYQFVGQIQAEKSKVETEILCEINDEDEFYCNDEQVCIDNFCYLDEDENGKPDENLPLKGHYYKINWGVTAPQDEEHTPYVDEDGKAVKFNIRLEGDGEVWLYKRKGAINEGVIELENGASDGGTLIKFLNEDYSEVCIYFHDDYKITDYWGESVDEICADFILVSKGTVEASSSGTDSITSSSAGVEENV